MLTLFTVLSEITITAFYVTISTTLHYTYLIKDWATKSWYANSKVHTISQKNSLMSSGNRQENEE